jgi:Flp pilus assembly protein TadG
MPCGSVNRRAFLRGSSGASAVEFAIIAPLLILFMMSIVYFGLYISASHSVQQLAADGARASVAGLGDPERRTLTIDYVNGAAPDYFLLDPDQINVGVVSDGSDAVTVTVTYDASDLLSWFPVSFKPVINPVITKSAVVRVGGF